MTQPTSRATLKDYCKRKLGHPVIQLNLDDDQMEDLIDDGLEIFQEYHFDGTYPTFAKIQLTADDITNKYVTVEDGLIGIKAVLPFYNDTSSSSNMFSVNYQYALNDLYTMGSLNSFSDYVFTQQKLSMIYNLFQGLPRFRFNRHMNRVFLDIDWEADVKAGDYIVFEAYKIVDPATYADIWKDIFLKKYVTSLFKRQWGQNLIKFEGMQLPGGITLNGRQLYDDAVQELEKMDEELSLKYELPVDFIAG